MKRWSLHYIYIGILLFLSASCSNYIEEDVSSAVTDKISVTFTLAMNASGSRAVITDEVGNSYENRIDADGLQVLFYDGDTNACLGKVENIVVFRTVSDDVYQFMGNLVIENATDYTLTSCKVMVFANSEEVTTSTEPAGLTFDYNVDGFRNKSVNIPMWGIASFNELRLAPGTNTDLGTIYLLRAMAKVEITLDETLTDNFKLIDVRFNKYNQKGQCLPKGYATINNTKDLDKAQWFNDNNSSQGENLQFAPYSDNGNYFVTYISEYDNSDGTLKMPISITNSDGTPLTSLNNPTIEFKNYEENSPLNVVRNHVYHFNIIKIGPSEQDITLEVTVEGYAEIDLSPSYGD